MYFINKLAEIEAQYEELTRQLSRPEVLADAALYPKTAKAHRELS
jgi:protein subunit release factor A